MTRHIALLPSKKDLFLSMRPDHLFNYIVDLADTALITSFLDCQYAFEIILENPDEYPGINIVQQDPEQIPMLLALTQVRMRECLLAQVNWTECNVKELVPLWFFNGMLASFSISGHEPIPSFFGPTIQTALENRRMPQFSTKLQVISDFPRCYNSYYYPAHHHLCIYHSDYWFSGLTRPTKPKIITDPHYYENFTSQFDPSLTWTLIAQTEIISLWITMPPPQPQPIPEPFTPTEPPTMIDEDGNSL